MLCHRVLRSIYYALYCVFMTFVSHCAIRLHAEHSIRFAAVNHSTVEKCKATNFEIGSDGFRVDQ
jgi:hypothetical protein